MGRMYCMGDIHGCHAEFQALLQALDFSPSRDVLYVLGDLVNRGPESAAVIRGLMALEGSAHCLLGNHDIHLLAVAQGLRSMHSKDTLRDVLDAPDAPVLLDWLRHLPLALHANNCLMVHAGVMPQWSVPQTLQCADAVSQALQAPDWCSNLAQIFGNQPACWHDDLQGMDRLRCSLNALTRMRMLHADGCLDFAHKLGPEAAPAGLAPWYAYPNRQTAHTLVAFGHWSTAGLVQSNNVLGLDTGCVWGGRLSAAEILPAGQVARIVQVSSHSPVRP